MDGILNVMHSQLCYCSVLVWHGLDVVIAMQDRRSAGVENISVQLHQKSPGAPPDRDCSQPQRWVHPTHCLLPGAKCITQTVQRMQLLVLIKTLGVFKAFL